MRRQVIYLSLLVLLLSLLGVVFLSAYLPIISVSMFTTVFKASLATPNHLPSQQSRLVTTMASIRHISAGGFRPTAMSCSIQYRGSSEISKRRGRHSMGYFYEYPRSIGIVSHQFDCHTSNRYMYFFQLCCCEKYPLHIRC